LIDIAVGQTLERVRRFAIGTVQPG